MCGAVGPGGARVVDACRGCVGLRVRWWWWWWRWLWIRRWRRRGVEGRWRRGRKRGGGGAHRWSRRVILRMARERRRRGVRAEACRLEVRELLPGRENWGTRDSMSCGGPVGARGGGCRSAVDRVKARAATRKWGYRQRWRRMYRDPGRGARRWRDRRRSRSGRRVEGREPRLRRPGRGVGRRRSTGPGWIGECLR